MKEQLINKINLIFTAITLLILIILTVFIIQQFNDKPILLSGEYIIQDSKTCDEIIYDYYNCRTNSDSIYWDYCNIFVEISISQNCNIEDKK